MAQRLMEVFNSLASLDQITRLDAATNLVSFLLHSQTATLNAEGANADVEYAQKRLIRGLASGRTGAREGFAIALTQLLIRLDSVVKPATILALVDELIPITGKLTSEEQREGQFGRVFAFAAVLRSQKISPDDAALNSSIVKSLLHFVKEKPAVRGLCCQLIIDVISSVNHDVAAQLVTLFPSTTPTPDSVAFDISLRQHHKHTCKPYLASKWTHRDPLHPDNLPVLRKVLSEALTESYAVHPVWSVILDRLTTTANPPVPLPEFWLNVVDAGMLGGSSSANQKATALKLFQSYFARLGTDPNGVVMLSPNLLQLFMANSGNAKTPIARAVKAALDTVIETCGKAGDEFSLSVIAQLTGPHGSSRFDRVTKSKTIQGLVSKLTPAGVTSYIDNLVGIFVSGKWPHPDASGIEEEEEPQQPDDDNDDDELDTAPKQLSVRGWVLAQMLALVRAPSVPKSDAWVLRVLYLTFLHSFHTQSKSVSFDGFKFSSPEAEVSKADRKACVNALCCILADVAVSAPFAEKTKTPGSKAGLTEDGTLRLFKLYQFAQHLTDKKQPLVKEFSEEDQEALAGTKATIEKFSGGESPFENEITTHDFQIFFFLHWLHVYLHEADAASSLSDLSSVLQGFSAAKSKPSKSSKKKEVSPDPAQVLMEVVLSTLSCRHGMNRKIVSHVFRGFTVLITPAAMQSLIEVLEKESDFLDLVSDDEDEDEEELEVDNSANKHSKKKHKKNHSDSESDDDSGDSDDDETQKHKKHKKAANESDDSDDEDEDEDDEEEEEDDEDDEEEEEDKADDENAVISESTKRKCMSILGIPEEEEEDLSDWDDDKMMQVDRALGAQFRIKKTQAKLAYEAQVRFKVCVLDLVEVFIKTQPSNPMILDLIMPLLNLARVSFGFKERKDLKERIVAIIKNKLFTLRDYPRGESLDVEKTHTLLETLFRYIQTSKHHQLALSGGECVLLLIRILIGGAPITESTAPIAATEASLTKEQLESQKKQKKKEKLALKKELESLSQLAGNLDISRLVGHLKPALQAVLGNKRTNFPKMLFEQIYQRFPVVAKHLNNDLTAFIESTGKEFHKIVAAKLLLNYFHHAAPTTPEGISAFVILAQSVVASVVTMLSKHVSEKSSAHIPAVRSYLQLLSTVVARSKGVSGEGVIGSGVSDVLRKLFRHPLSDVSAPIRATSMQILRSLGENVDAEVEFAKGVVDQKKKDKDRKKAERIKRRASKAEKVEKGEFKSKKPKYDKKPANAESAQKESKPTDSQKPIKPKFTKRDAQSKPKASSKPDRPKAEKRKHSKAQEE